MAVVKATIKAALLSLENDAKATEMTEDTYCDRLADIIRNAIQSGTPAGTAGGDPLIGGTIS
jgi:hypothetical protein